MLIVANSCTEVQLGFRMYVNPLYNSLYTV